MRIFIAIVAFMFSNLLFAEGNPDKGKALYGICSACHGPNGEGQQALNAPKLSGQQDWYVVRQLQNYKKGVRGSHPQDVYGKQMAPMAMTLVSDEAIADVSAYIASLPANAAAATVEGNAATGKALYGVCAACHGMNGEGQQALNAPAIAGMSDWYLARQIQNFKNGVRGSHKDDMYGKQMAPMASILANDQAINDVMAYLNSLN